MRVHVAVCGLAGGSELCENMEWVLHRMRFSVDIQPKRRLREQELFGELRAVTRVALNGAAFLEQEDKTMLRVVDLHPWIAEAAEPQFNDGHYRQAVIAAAISLENRWRKLLGVATPNMSQLAQESFTDKEPTPEHPRLRYAAVGTDTNTQAWKDAHNGAMQYAKGCAMRIRNLSLHHPEDSEPDAGETVETLTALSVLARWVTDAEVQAAAER